MVEDLADMEASLLEEVHFHHLEVAPQVVHHHLAVAEVEVSASRQPVRRAIRAVSAKEGKFQ